MEVVLSLCNPIQYRQIDLSANPTRRARRGMEVSVPVSSDELPSLTGGDHWSVVTALDRLDTGNSP